MIARRAICVLSAYALAACTTVTSNYSPEYTEISWPPLGQVVTAKVGDDLLRQGKHYEVDAINLLETMVVDGYTLEPGYFLKKGEDEESEFFYSEPGLHGSKVSRSSAAMEDPFDALQIYRNSQKLCVIAINGFSDCTDSPKNYKRVKRPAVAADGFQQTLLYNGKVGNKINIGYREYSQDAARPSYNNDVEYDLLESKVIGYRGAELEIIEATNLSISYRVRRNFNQAVR